MAKEGWELTDEQWARIEPLLPKPKPSKRGGRPRANDRACFEGVLWVLRGQRSTEGHARSIPVIRHMLASAA